MKRCLIVVDYQNDFVVGALGFESAAALDGRIAAKINAYHKRGDTVIFTLDTHGEDYGETREGRYLPVAHCILGTPGHALYGETGASRTYNDICFSKPAFGSDELYEYLKANPFDAIELAGVVSNICVISNAVLAKTAQPEADIVVDAACVASNDEGLNRAALDVMQSLQIEVLTGAAGV
ncbi:MAG: cysteine hydrolase [Eubacteriales bacterium]|nr:cysteine hydrolase [Eubacteriales bacterium]